MTTSISSTPSSRPSSGRGRTANGKQAGPKRPGFRLTARDVEIIDSVYTHRALTSLQIARLLFPSRTSGDPVSSRCRRRLRLLYEHGFLQRIEQPVVLSDGRKPLVYFLDRSGAELLREAHGLEPAELDWHPRDNTIRHGYIEHLLLTNDVRIAITLAAAGLGWAVETWVDDKSLRSRQLKDYVTIQGPQGQQRKAAVVPDGFFVLGDGRYRYHCFLEVDRSTVVGRFSKWGRRDWSRKAQVYLAYHASGLYERRYQTKSMRVLTVTTGEKRLANLKQVTEKAGGKARFWFTTFDQVTPGAVLTEPVWQVSSTTKRYSISW